jgi:hypothetical protein
MTYSKFLTQEVRRVYALRNGTLRPSRHALRGLIWELRVITHRAK